MLAISTMNMAEVPRIVRAKARKTYRMKTLYTQTRLRWGIKWVSDDYLDGHTEHFMGNPAGWFVFRTRAEARAYRDEHYGYFRDRLDLKVHPFGWKLLRVVKVVLSIQEYA